MKKSFLLAMLLSLTLGAVLSGCSKAADQTPAPPAATNAPAGTNAP